MEGRTVNPVEVPSPLLVVDIWVVGCHGSVGVEGVSGVEALAVTALLDVQASLHILEEHAEGESAELLRQNLQALQRVKEVAR